MHGRDGNHRALFVSLAIQRPVLPLDPAPVAQTSQTAVARLTAAESTIFRTVDWAPVLMAVDTVLASGSPSRAQSEAVLRVLEEGVVSHLAAV